jgi:hypothetical protein
MYAVENLVEDEVVVAQDGLQFMSLDETSCQQSVARQRFDQTLLSKDDE